MFTILELHRFIQNYGAFPSGQEDYPNSKRKSFWIGLDQRSPTRRVDRKLPVTRERISDSSQTVAQVESNSYLWETKFKSLRR
jgi:hypothetical protein